ncbi:phage tail repeat-like family [Trichomonas vaginalis G3]|uniref:phage tail repeat-like family n=1 Tax=Trichomonas vaginalis (strain ATCC PRA-98 / G3) TaxID=412133 RepID=UPI0021E57352|nr:phage tail repeat-like family [Trichomonas vaginalis G3]KAI5494573.1 phage tail repeat-like family [Trichomonas vaginalis G3]
MSKDIASMREIQHNRQLIMQALNKNTTNFSNYSKISESLKEGNLKLTLNPLTDEFLFQDNKNNTVCINPTKGTLNEKPINELLLKADIDNKADKEYVDDAIAKEEERANNAYATKEHTHPELADKTYVDNKMSSEVTRAENEYSKKTHIHSISEITDLQETLNRKSAVGHTHTSSEITDLNVSLEKKADKNHTHDFFTTVAIESIEGTFEETDGDVLYWKLPNFPQGLTSDDDITTMKNIRCKDVYVMKDEHNIKFTAQDLYDKKADKTELQTLKTEILQTLYPIGSIYTSMNSTRPEVVLGFGTWTQIVDRFLYCANSSKETGGSKTISGENLPAHSHYIDLSTSQAGWHKHKFWDWSAMKKGKGYDVKDDVQFAINCFWGNTKGDGNHTHRVSGYTQTTGQSKEYMPPYMTVYAWYRIA